MISGAWNKKKTKKKTKKTKNPEIHSITLGPVFNYVGACKTEGIHQPKC